MNKYRTLDLFAGAGGLSLGFKMAGDYEIVAAAEINKNAQNTYMNNIPASGQPFDMIDNVVGYDFLELNKRAGGIDVVIGGPPCQGFSNANRQKNHLISMNNGLVKEYFRAVKDIQPKAFIMENVNMLQSDKHRFFESSKDNELINQLREKGANIPLQSESLFIANSDIREINMSTLETGCWKELVFSKQLSDLIRILNKDLKNKKRLPAFIEKNKSLLIKQITSYCSEKENKTVEEMLMTIKENLENNTIENSADDVAYLAEMQKALSRIAEIKDNNLIGDFYCDLKGNVLFETSSYSVIDYINAILGDDYVQVGATLNSKWFGVPQDRKRFLVMGIRKDLVTEPISLPNPPDNYEIVTVGEAINDLAEYPVSYATDGKTMPYKAGEQLSGFAISMRLGSDGVSNHFATQTRSTALKRFKAIKQGENFHSLSDTMKSTYSDPSRTQNTIYLRLDPNEPSGTVVNVRKSMWIHPELDRAISVREAARLQSFPDNYIFSGTKDSQYQQIGNAVPPLLAKAVALQLKTYLS